MATAWISAVLLAKLLIFAPKLYDIYVTVEGKAAHAGIAPERRC